MTEPLASRAGKVSYEGGSATLTFERHIGHPIEDVWDAITGSEPLQRWYMSKAIIEGRKDGRIELWSGSAQVHVTGRILTWDPPRPAFRRVHRPAHSTTVASPWPTPTQRVARPWYGRFSFGARRRIS